MQNRGTWRRGCRHVENRGKHVVVNLDQVNRLFGNVGAGSGNGGDSMALVQYFIFGKDVIAHK